MTNIRVLFDQHCGQTECDIHGTHNTRMIVEMADYLRYNLIVQSECYTDTNYSRITKEELAERLLEWQHLPHTRWSIRRFRGLVRRLQSHEYRGYAQWQKLNLTERPSAIPAEQGNTFGLLYCPCPQCVSVRAQRAEGVERLDNELVDLVMEPVSDPPTSPTMEAFYARAVNASYALMDWERELLDNPDN